MITIEINQNQSIIYPWLTSLESPLTAKIRKTLQGWELKQAQLLQDAYDRGEDIQERDTRFRCERDIEATAVITRKGLVITPVPLFQANSDNSGGVFYTGLLSIVLKHLKRVKREYTVIDNRDKSMLRDTLPEFPDVAYREHQEDVLRKLLSSSNGIIKAVPAFGKSFIIGIYCKMRCMEERIMVVTNRKSVLTDLFKRIGQDIGTSKVCIVGATKVFDPRKRVAVVSAFSMHHIPSDWPGVILYDEVHGAAAPCIGRELMRFSEARFYGFSGTPKGRGDGGDLIGESLFGDIIHEVGYDQALASGNVTDMEVRIVKVKGDPAPNVRDKIDFDRQNIWRNSVRNMKIADVVKALEKDGIEKILIFVTTAEHAYYLRMFLPNFEVVHNKMSPAKIAQFHKQGLLRPGELCDPDVEALKEGFKGTVYTKVIASMIWREGLSVDDLGVVIRADAQSGVISTVQIGGRSSRIFEGKTLALCIDFQDDFGHEMLAKSQARIRHYRAEGWRVIDWEV